MTIETLKDVLHWTTNFHQKLSDCLTHSTDNNENERAKMLLVYLAEHERELANVVAQFEKNGNTHALNTWCYEFIDKHPLTQHQLDDAIFAKLDATEIMARVVDQHQQVIELYRYLFTRADIPSARALLENLKSLEEHEAMQMSQGANRLSDL